MIEFKIHSFETMSEVSLKSSVKFVNYVKRDQKVNQTEKHSRRSPGIQSKELIEKFGKTVTDQQIEQCQPTRQTISKIEKCKIIKQTKEIFDKTLEAFTLKAKFSPSKDTH